MELGKEKEHFTGAYSCKINLFDCICASFCVVVFKEVNTLRGMLVKGLKLG